MVYWTDVASATHYTEPTECRSRVLSAITPIIWVCKSFALTLHLTNGCAPFPNVAGHVARRVRIPRSILAPECANSNYISDLCFLGVATTRQEGITPRE